jgi:TolB-like protein/DNA-binding winged helix-turn-helix (wHTH) protein/Flp pilus assembly protein TadD
MYASCQFSAVLASLRRPELPTGRKCIHSREMDTLHMGFRLGDCEIYPEDGTVHTPAGLRHIGPRPMALLLHLASDPGRVFSRTELMAAVWASIVVSDETLSRCIADLRQALGDDARHARYIDTLARRGYRLKVHAEPLAAAETSARVPASSPGSHDSPKETRPGATARSRRPGALPLFLGAVGVLILLTGIAAGVVFRSAEPPLPLAENGIAVLPFANLSDDPSLDYFSEGLAEELLNTLSAQDELQVVARTSTFGFRDTVLDIRDIGRRLGVAFVLEGSVRRDVNRVRVTVQLIDARDGFHRFSQTYDRPLADFIHLQEQLALEVGAAITPRLAQAEAWDRVRRGSAHWPAVETYLLGKHLQHKVTPESLERAAEQFRTAIALDPSYAVAHASLAETLALASQYGDRPIALVRDEIEALAETALALDARTASAWHARGLLAFYERRLDDAIEHFQRAVSLTRDSSRSATMLARTLHLRGDNREALGLTRQALRSDPLNPFIMSNHAVILRQLGEFEEAERWLRRAMEVDPEYLNAYWALAYVKWLTGHPVEAANWYRLGIDKGIRESGVYAELARVLIDLGEFAEARRWVDRALGQAPDPVAYLGARLTWHASQGDVAGIVATVEEYDARFPGHPTLPAYRAMAALYSGYPAAAVAEYESLAGIDSERLHHYWDMNFGTWHALYLALARRSAGHERALQMSLPELERRLAAYVRQGGVPGHIFYYRAGLALLKGDRPAALEALEQARQAGWRRHWQALHDPILAELKDDPRFNALLALVRQDLEGQLLAAAR